MSTLPDIPVKPRLLIADDSKIVRTALIKHIEGMFEFREAMDGEQAWETLLIDPTIRVVITDLTMPKLDGYGLLQRIRSSKISRIRDIPVVVVSGSDEQGERTRAKIAGANDLITKGIDTAQLLSRLEILSKLEHAQPEHTLQQNVKVDVALQTRVDTATESSALPNLSATLKNQVERLLVDACTNRKEFVMLSVCIGVKSLKHPDTENNLIQPPSIDIANFIEKLLRRTIRDTDLAIKTGNAEFALATGSINHETGRLFAERVFRTMMNTNIIKTDHIVLLVSCGIVSLSDGDYRNETSLITLKTVYETAHRRARLGLEQGTSGIIGMEEENDFRQKGQRFKSLSLSPADIQHEIGLPEGEGGKVDAPDLATLLDWIKKGRREDVLHHLDKLSTELQPLVDLLLQQEKR